LESRLQRPFSAPGQHDRAGIFKQLNTARTLLDNAPTGAATQRATHSKGAARVQQTGGKRGQATTEENTEGHVEWSFQHW
jgi:hypothetical protein